MKRLQSPSCGVFLIAVAMALYFIVCYALRMVFGVFDVEEVGATEALTYLFYGFSGGVAFMLYGDYINTPRQRTYFAICFLWFWALLREMGFQHWLTRHDTTAIKIRFFTNPNNPLHEKILTLCILALIFGTLLYLLIKYWKWLVRGFSDSNPVCCTIVTLCVWTAVTQFADRFPWEYKKLTGEKLTEPVIFFLRILEEGGESLLPLLFAVALLQFHFMLRQRTVPEEHEQPEGKHVTVQNGVSGW